jgi:hypothetical protein
MLSHVFRRAFCTCAALAILVACGGAQTPAGPPIVQIPPAASSLLRGTLMYAPGDESSYVFTFPKGKVVSTIATTAFGACADRNGNVFFTQVKDIVEYRHGGTVPVATFPFAGSVNSCSIDPATGKLAAVVFCIRRCGEEVVVLSPDGHKSRYHVRSLTSLLYCAYDDNGDLFVDGDYGVGFGLAELPKGSAAFMNITLKHPIKFAGQIQWDGKDLAIETRVKPVIYRVAISGSTARVVGRIHLKGVGYRATQSWIANGKIAVPTGPGTKRAIEIMVWNYPAGGNPTNVFKGFIGKGHAMIDGVTFSFN